MIGVYFIDPDVSKRIITYGLTCRSSTSKGSAPEFAADAVNPPRSPPIATASTTAATTPSSRSALALRSAFMARSSPVPSTAPTALIGSTPCR